jgi:hypothetical protein
MRFKIFFLLCALLAFLFAGCHSQEQAATDQPAKKHHHPASTTDDQNASDSDNSGGNFMQDNDATDAKKATEDAGEQNKKALDDPNMN